MVSRRPAVKIEAVAVGLAPAQRARGAAAADVNTALRHQLWLALLSYPPGCRGIRERRVLLPEPLGAAAAAVKRKLGL